MNNSHIVKKDDFNYEIRTNETVAPVPIIVSIGEQSKYMELDLMDGGDSIIISEKEQIALRDLLIQIHPLSVQPQKDY